MIFIFSYLISFKCEKKPRLYLGQLQTYYCHVISIWWKGVKGQSGSWMRWPSWYQSRQGRPWCQSFLEEHTMLVPMGVANFFVHPFPRGDGRHFPELGFSSDSLQDSWQDHNIYTLSDRYNLYHILQSQATG